MSYNLKYIFVVIPEFQNIKDSPFDVNATETESITINCRAYAKPMATVKWFINGETFSSKLILCFF